MRFSAFLAAVTATLFLGASHVWALDLQDLYGVWRYPENGSLIQIYACGKATCAKVVRVTDPSRKDIYNPDPALRNRPIVGIVMWQHGKETGPLQWSGSLYNTLDGRTYYGTLRLTGKTALTLSGCYLHVMLCEHRTWTKLKPEMAKAVLSTLAAKHAKKPPAKEKNKAKKPKEPVRQGDAHRPSLLNWRLAKF